MPGKHINFVQVETLSNCGHVHVIPLKKPKHRSALMQIQAQTIGSVNQNYVTAITVAN